MFSSNGTFTHASLTLADQANKALFSKSNGQLDLAIQTQTYCVNSVTHSYARNMNMPEVKCGVTIHAQKLKQSI